MINLLKLLRFFFNNSGNEAKETKQASYLLFRFVKEGKLSKKEEKQLKLQFYDVLKIMV